MTKAFHERRRQQFLTQPFYAATVAHIEGIAKDLESNVHGGKGDSDDRRGWSYFLSDDAYRLLSIRYTAGELIEQLRAELSNVVDAYERYQHALAEHEQIPSVAPLGLGHLGDYERCMQLIGLCYLLHRRDLLPRIAALEDPAYAGDDAFYEELLDYGLPDRYDTDAMLHIEVYDPLIHAMYAETEEERVDDLQRYVRNWYPAFKYVPWHDGHLRIDGTDGDYFGYWAFEAGAVALLCDIDDSSVSHMVYPKDLVTWARANKHLSDSDAADPTAIRLRCEAGQPCPREGFWFTPAQANSRRQFKAGDVMPEASGDYGATIWQWDGNQR